MHNIAAGLVKVITVLAPGSVVVAQVQAEVERRPLTVEGVAVAFAGLTVLATLATIAATYVTSREHAVQLRNMAREFKGVGEILQKHEASIADLSGRVEAQESVCAVRHRGDRR